MASSVPDLMVRLRQSSARLNQLSDEAAETIKATEEFLTKECSTGITCRITFEYDEDHDAGMTCTRYLGFQRFGSKFRIVVGESCSYEPEDLVKPWSDCNRETKIETIDLLPKLLEEIVKTAEEKVRTAESAIRSVESQIGKIPPKKKGE